MRSYISIVALKDHKSNLNACFESVTLVLVNTCQIGLVSWYVPKSLDGVSHPEVEEEFQKKVETQQMVTLTLQLVSHLMVLLASIVAQLGIRNMMLEARQFVN